MTAHRRGGQRDVLSQRTLLSGSIDYSTAARRGALAPDRLAPGIGGAANLKQVSRPFVFVLSHALAHGEAVLLSFRVHLVAGSQNQRSCRKSGQHSENPVSCHGFHFWFTSEQNSTLNACNSGYYYQAYLQPCPSLHTSLL